VVVVEVEVAEVEGVGEFEVPSARGRLLRGLRLLNGSQSLFGGLNPALRKRAATAWRERLW
jgi:hypothetical protein